MNYGLKLIFKQFIALVIWMRMAHIIYVHVNAVPIQIQTTKLLQIYLLIIIHLNA